MLVKFALCQGCSLHHSGHLTYGGTSGLHDGPLIGGTKSPIQAGQRGLDQPRFEAEPFRPWCYEVIDTKLATGDEGQYGPPNNPVLGLAFGDAGGRTGLRLRGYAGYQLYAGNLPDRRLCRLLSARQE